MTTINTIKLARNIFQTIIEGFDFDLKTKDLSEVKEMIGEVKDYDLGRWEDFRTNEDSDLFRAFEILLTCSDACDCDFDDFTITEIMDLIEEINNKTEIDDDFCIDLPCGECRLIGEDNIDEIWTDSLIETIKECYDLSDVPSFVVIDWEQTAENCKVDGMGYHFASYDHEEHFNNGFYIFRTN